MDLSIQGVINRQISLVVTLSGLPTLTGQGTTA